MNIVGESWETLRIYIEDYKESIKERDRLKLPFRHASNQYEMRGFLVNHLRKFYIENNLKISTLLSSVYILDGFMDGHNIEEEKLILIANVCLLLAAKMDEAKWNIPAISVFGNTYKLTEYKSMEIYILKALNWFVNFPTPASYAHYYFQGILDHVDVETLKKTSVTVREAYFELNSYLICALNKFIDDIHYMQFFRTSELAAAAVSFSRLKFGLTGWNTQLSYITGYFETDLEKLRDQLMEDYPLRCSYCPMNG